MFGRRSRESRQAADREQSRRALFEELAKRPANICPFLGLASSQTEYHEGFTREHRCYAFGDPVELSAEQQERVCLGRGYGNCPRYLRGVLVIPTDELEALRRPQPAGPPPPPVTPTPAPRPARDGGGRRRGVAVLVGAVMLLAVAGTVGALVLFKGPGIGTEPSASPSPSVVASASGTSSPSGGPSVTPVPVQTPFPETPKPDPTPLPGDTFVGYEVTVLEGENTLFEVNDAGDIVRTETANFSRFSKAPVARTVAANGLLHWRTTEGFFTGLSYIHGQSGAFLIREVYRGADGTERYIVLSDEDV